MSLSLPKHISENRSNVQDDNLTYEIYDELKIKECRVTKAEFNSETHLLNESL